VTEQQARTRDLWALLPERVNVVRRAAAIGINRQLLREALQEELSPSAPREARHDERELAATALSSSVAPRGLGVSCALPRRHRCNGTASASVAPRGLGVSCALPWLAPL
jgi:hypothetical protein